MFFFLCFLFFSGSTGYVYGAPNPTIWPYEVVDAAASDQALGMVMIMVQTEYIKLMLVHLGHPD